MRAIDLFAALRRRCGRSAALPAAASVVCSAACGESTPTMPTVPPEPPPPEVESPPSCSSPRTSLTGEVSGVLDAASSPFLLQGEVTTGTLAIGGGVLVCGAAGSRFAVRDTLRVAATEDRPVVFTAVDGDDGWGGIAGEIRTGTHAMVVGGAFVRMRHAVVEHAGTGVKAAYVDLASVRIRQSVRSAIRASSGTLTEVVADTACREAEACSAV